MGLLRVFCTHCGLFQLFGCPLGEALSREGEGTGEFLSRSGKYQGLYLDDTETWNVGQAREESLDKDTDIFLSLFSDALTK